MYRVGRSNASKHLAEPDDGVFRPDCNPVDTAIQPTFTTDLLPLAPITPTEAWVKLDGAAAYVVGDSLINNVNYTYPLSFGFTLTTAFNAEIKQALLLRVGYFYSYRGDDPTPPDMKGWLMLVARHRTGALI